MYFKTFVLAAVVVAALAETAPKKEDDRVKKDVLLGTYPYAYAAVPSYVPSAYVYDDGKYYPGKYDKAYVAAPAVHHVPSAYAVPASTAYAVPASTAYVSGYHFPSYPSYVAGYPYVKSYVY